MNDLLNNLLSGFLNNKSKPQTYSKNTYPSFVEANSNKMQNGGIQNLLLALLSGKESADMLDMLTGGNPLATALLANKKKSNSSLEKIESDKIDTSSLTKIDT